MSHESGVLGFVQGFGKTISNSIITADATDLEGDLSFTIIDLLTSNINATCSCIFPWTSDVFWVG